MKTVLRPNSRTPGDSNISPNVPRIHISCPKNDRHSCGRSVSASLSPSRGAAPPPLLRSLHLTCFNLHTRPPEGLPLRPRLAALYPPRWPYICHRILLPPFLPGHQLVLTLLSTLFLPHPCSTWVTPSQAPDLFLSGSLRKLRGPPSPRHLQPVRVQVPAGVCPYPTKDRLPKDKMYLIHLQPQAGKGLC